MLWFEWVIKSACQAGGKDGKRGRDAPPATTQDDARQIRRERVYPEMARCNCSTASLRDTATLAVQQMLQPLPMRADTIFYASCYAFFYAIFYGQADLCPEACQ